MTDDIIQQQIAYYRARATEYDEWFYRLGRYDHGNDLNRQWFKEVEVVIRALHQIGPVGKILELAAGTGNWTQELLKIGQHITAVDASPEMIEINRRKFKATNVDYVQADLFTWKPDIEYDMVFFGFWLSHVPPEKLELFLNTVRKSLRGGGKLFLVDSRFEKTSSAKDHVLEPERGIHVTRKLNDGQEFTIVKIFYEPETLQPKLEQVGFDAQVHVTDHYFVYAQGVRRG
jgi:demethylmenaquinone methyltransferase/2-methoxy-6-polyprenyl-1,4-benzoquinol methylase